MDDLERAKEVKDAEATVSSVDSTSDVEGQGSGDGGGDGGGDGDGSFTHI